MNLREENNAGFLALLEIAGEEIIQPDGKPDRALVTDPQLDSDFVPGAELINERIRFRVLGKPCFDLQTIWRARGKEWRWIEAQPFGATTLMILEDPD